MIRFFCFLLVAWMITPSVIYAGATRRPKWSEIAIWKITCQFTVTHREPGTKRRYALSPNCGGVCIISQIWAHFLNKRGFFLCSVYGLWLMSHLPWCLAFPKWFPIQNNCDSSWNLNIIAGENLCQKQDNIFVSHHKQIFWWVEFGIWCGKAPLRDTIFLKFQRHTIFRQF